MLTHHPIKVTVIGGGTGSFGILTGLRNYSGFQIQSIVTMMDSGGHSGQLRDAFGVLPPGDIRRCMVALSDESMLLRNLFSFRFEEAPLDGSNFGNLFILALTKLLGSEEQAIEAAAKILKIRGDVIPVTFDHVHLCAELSNGSIICGEGNIDTRGLTPNIPIEHDPKYRIAKVYLKPEATANPRAMNAIAGSDVIVIAPGDMYTSTIPNFLVSEIAEVIRRCQAPLIYMMNLMTKHGETDGWTASRHVSEIIKYVGRAPDVVIAHKGEAPKQLLSCYQTEHAAPVEVDSEKLQSLGVKILRQANLMSVSSVARHDPKSTAKKLNDIFVELGLRTK